MHGDNREIGSRAYADKMRARGGRYGSTKASEAIQRTAAQRGCGTVTIEKAEAEAVQTTGAYRGAVRR